MGGFLDRIFILNLIVLFYYRNWGFVGVTSVFGRASVTKYLKISLSLSVILKDT